MKANLKNKNLGNSSVVPAEKKKNRTLDSIADIPCSIGHNISAVQ